MQQKRAITITVDPVARTIYIRLTDNRVKKTIEPFPEVFLDLDYRGRPIGIEMLNPGHLEYRELKEFEKLYDLPSIETIVEKPPVAMFA